MIVIIALYKASIRSFFENISISILYDKIMLLYKYIIISYPIVNPVTSSNTVILLSFDKFLSKYPPQESYCS